MTDVPAQRSNLKTKLDPMVGRKTRRSELSYSFNVRSADKAEAAAAVAAEFDKVVIQQPVHEADRAQAETNAIAALGLVPDPAGDEEISVSVSGYVQWRGVLGGEEPVTITGVNLSAHASLVAKTA